MTTRIAPGVGANLLGQHSAERNQDATVYVGNLESKAGEELLWELFVQAGPVVNVYVPKDRVTNAHQGYGFVEFRSEEDADYAIKVLNMLKLFGKPIRVNKDVDEKLLYDTFSAFGVIVANPKIMRDPETGNSRGFGFISYDSFEASDASIECLMHTRKILKESATVPLQFSSITIAERVLAASNPTTQRSRPHTMFASGPPTIPQQNGGVNAPVAPRPFTNGPVPPPPVPALGAPPPQNMYQPMQMQVPSWQGQPPQPGHAGIPPPMQQFRSMPPPPPQMAPAPMRPPPPPSGMAAPPGWRPPPPPQHLMGGTHPMQHMMPPPQHMNMAPQ
ncbi:hypothetical protein SASPL_125103 [Salvia splendens]|uniref:RRM domain-containing protein n=1 Tax=Salvia splendens TaxID=180675 RepID=A0A8X8XD82_SALSN|nr:hypothetical protein SASPL_125103 [Salvia splendens]